MRRMRSGPQQTSVPGPHPQPAEFSDSYRRYALSLLLVVYVFNFIDRQILNILAEAIRLDLGLSDTALGFLGGIAFAVFYTFAGIPIARWADRGPRRSIIALGLLVWSGMTAVSGLARSFTHLALARVGVGLGEAACTPPAHSLLSDLYPPERRGTAFSIYALGIPIGSAIGTFAGGWIKEIFDWRTAFFVVGLPGILLAAVVRLTLREPPRPARPVASATRETTLAVLRYMQRLASFRHLSLAAALHAFYGYGAAFFLPVFMIRVHGFSEGELSTYLALIALIGGGLGTFLGGFVCDRLAPRDRRYYVWVPAISTAVGIPFAAALYLSADRYVALGYAVPAALLGSMYLGPTFAISQGLARPHMRALVSAILLFIINLVGLGLGPQVVGVVSDLLKPELGVESVRYALLIVVAAGAAWSTLHYALAARTLRADLDLARSAD
jgi:predicted MFS family arabinose efflux permease